MTDVRAILEKQSEIRRMRERWNCVFAYLCAFSFVVVAIMYHSKGRPVMDSFRLLFPILFVNGAGVFYSARHIQALRDAIADPDPALDAHFAEALSMELDEVAKIGREAFLQRFAERAPQLGSIGWAHVAEGLAKASTGEAESLLRLLADHASASAIDPMEAFASKTKVDRLQTATRTALGDLRLHVARGRVLGAASVAQVSTQQEAERLGFGEPLRQS